MRWTDVLCLNSARARARGGRLLASLLLYLVFVQPSLLPAATLSGSFSLLTPGTTVDLSAEGQLDWGHWGLVTEWSYTRKYGVAEQITNSFITDVQDQIYPYPDGPWLLNPRAGGITGFSWTNGTPFAAAILTTNGVSIFGDRLSGNSPTGFHIQCPADTSQRMLKVYVGTSGGKATFSASLPGAAAYMDSSFGGATGALSGVYTLGYQADSIGQMLTVNFTSTDVTSCITLQAATLAGTNAPPTVAITAPADGTTLAAPATFSLSAAAADSDGTVTNLSLFQGTNLLGQATSGSLTMPLVGLPAGAYSFFAVATDNGGLSVTSFPTRVYVITNGGTLTGSADTPPVSQDLTAEGTRDWAHWGLSSPASFDRKAGVAALIPNLTLLNASTTNLNAYGDNMTAFSWEDGTPTAAVLGSPTGVFLYATNTSPAEYQLSVPAAAYLRRLRVYVGLYAAQGRLDAWLSDSSAVPYSDSSLLKAYSNGWVVYTLTFASDNPGANLVVRWTPAAVFDPLFGNLTWQAATLGEQPSPILRVVSPPTGSPFALSFFAQSGTNYTVQYADTPGSTNWQDLTNFVGAEAEVLAVDPGQATSARFYRVLVH